MPEREGIEELLPSQLVEDLLEKGEASHTTADAFLVTMGLDINATTALPPQLEMVEALAGLVLSEPELKRFEKRGIQGHNIAVSNTIMAARSAEDLSFYDGIITDPVLKKWLAAWADRHIYSVSQLDTVVGCSYRFFSERLLNLDELEEADDLLPAHTFGSIVHGLLAHFYRDWVDCGGNIPGPKDEALAREKLVGAFELEEENIGELSDFAADLLRLKLFGDLSVKEFGSSKLPLVEVRNSGLLGQFLTMEMERAGAGGADGFRPRNFEVGFGQGLVEDDDPLTAPEPLDLQLGENQSIRLRGRIDRIDVSADGAFVVTDYKTGYVPMKAHIGEGFRTQLPVYLMVAEELLKAQFDNPEAAGGIYFPLKPADNPKISGMFIKKSYQAQLGIGGRSCLSEEDFNEVLDTVKVIMRRSLRAVRDGKLTTTWRDEKVVCAFCPFESFCYRDVERTRNFWDRQEIGVSGETG